MYKLGIDLGGTNIVAGVVDENFKIIGIGRRKPIFQVVPKPSPTIWLLPPSMQ